MTTDTDFQRATPPQREDARDLIARLCREMGVTAVAQALEASEPDETRAATTPLIAIAA